VSNNGYHYTRTERKWELTHHLIAAEKLGRPIEDDETCRFADGDRTNLHPDNIVVQSKVKKTTRKQLDALYVKRDELEQQIAHLEKVLEEEYLD